MVENFSVEKLYEYKFLQNSINYFQGKDNTLCNISDAMENPIICPVKK